MTADQLRQALHMLNDLACVSGSSMFLKSITFTFDGTEFTFVQSQGDWCLDV